MLEQDPDKRPTPKDILSSPWFKEDKEAIEDLLAFNRSIANKDHFN
jgi:serine/threonine protein kinase